MTSLLSPSLRAPYSCDSDLDFQVASTVLEHLACLSAKDIDRVALLANRQHTTENLTDLLQFKPIQEVKRFLLKLFSDLVTH